MSHPQNRPQTRRTETGVPGATRGLPRRPSLGGAVLAALALLGCVGIASPAAAAVLPEGRVYEQVSPEFKGGYPVLPETHKSALAEDGEAATFASVGAFSGSGQSFAVNDYVAKRTADGWRTEGISPPPHDQCWEDPEVFSADLSRFQFQVEPGSSFGVCSKSATNTLWVRQPDGSPSQVSPAMTTASGDANSAAVEGGSANLSRLVISRSDTPELHVIPEDETEALAQLFEAEASSLRLVALDNEGGQLTRYCNVDLGGRATNGFGSISQPGASEVFFSVSVNSLSEKDCEEPETSSPGHPVQLFVRVGGNQTVEVSKPLAEACAEVPCPGAAKRAPALFQGASEDGSKVFFTTTQPLVEGDTDHSDNLYVATIGCVGGSEGEACGSESREVTSLALASRDPLAGQAGEVEPEVVAVSPDGSHVYFVARGVLSENPNGQGESAVDGAENLYVYDGTSAPGSVSFIADLCSGPERSGKTSDVHCPGSLNEGEGNQGINDRGLWSGTEYREAQTTQDGNFLVFGTYAQLIRFGPEADIDTAKDIYRYDAQSGGLRRVSIGEGGFDGNGNDSRFDATITRTEFRGALQEQDELGDRAITEDGSKIVFTTSEPLSPNAANHQQDVYVWSEGRVGMISSGSATEPDEEPVISPSGRDIMLLTNAGLVPGDTDGLADLYDARIGGGFPLPEALAEPCAGDACQGSLSTPAPILLPGSMSQPAGGNLPASTAAPVAAGKKKVGKMQTVKRKRAKKVKRYKAKAKQGGRVDRSAYGATRGRRGR